MSHEWHAGYCNRLGKILSKNLPKYTMMSLLAQYSVGIVTGSYVDVLNNHLQIVQMTLFQSARLPPRKSGFDSRPGHVSLVTSSLGWR
jgi:hypothetical protein